MLRREISSIDSFLGLVHLQDIDVFTIMGTMFFHMCKESKGAFSFQLLTKLCYLR